MKKIESSANPLTRALFRISVFDKIEQTRPILKVPKASHYHLKKSQLKIIQAIFLSQISLHCRFTQFKNKIIYLNTQ